MQGPLIAICFVVVVVVVVVVEEPMAKACDVSSFMWCACVCVCVKTGWSDTG